MKKLLLLAVLFTVGVYAQQSTIPTPRDAKGYPLSHGLGGSYASSVVVTVTSYDTSVRYQVPSSGNDAMRAFRHIYVLNRSTTRTVSVCFGDENGCTDDAMIVRPEYGLIFEPVLFGAAVGKEYVYFKLDAAGSANVDVSVW